MDEETLSELINIIKKRRIEGRVEGDLGSLDYRIGRKDARGTFNIDDATIKAMLGYDGNWSLNAHKPLWGGNLNFDASKGDDGNRQFYLRFQKQF